MEAEAYRQEMVELLCRLIERDTTNPPGNEHLVAQVVEDFFKKEGISYEVFEKGKGRTNIIGHIGTGKPKLMIACHSDVVPAGDGWTADPFKPQVKDGRVYGRGAADNKDSLASMLITAKMLKSRISKGTLILAALADEEIGSEYGLNYLMDEKRLDFDHCIVPDIGGNMRKIDVAEKGVLFIKAVSKGRQAHGSTPEEGVNAIWNMLLFLSELKAHKIDFSPHPLLKSPSLNLGLIRGGNAPNIVPGECEAYIDIRYLPSQDKVKIMESLRALIGKAKEKDSSVDISLEIMTHHNPSESEDNVRLAEIFRECTRQVTGFTPQICGLGGHTYAGLLMEKGFNAIGVGLGDDVAHQADEYIDIDELVAFTSIMNLACIKILEGKDDISGI